MKETDPAEKRFLRFQNKLLSMIQTIDELLEDPLFMDSISGTEEVGLDQTKEFLNNILADLEDPGKNIMTVDEIIASRLPEET
jgi:hypothetical protein